eukprot:8531107-Ditylum_brightwellii.AAC.2
MVVIQGLLQHLHNGKKEQEHLRHIVIALLGEFKGKCRERWHLLLLTDTTESGFKPRIWTERVAKLLTAELKKEGVVMCKLDGSLMSSHKLEEEFHTQLSRVQESHPQLIDDTVDVAEVFGISRSLCQGSNSRATDQG